MMLSALVGQEKEAIMAHKGTLAPLCLLALSLACSLPCLLTHGSQRYAVVVVVVIVAVVVVV
jgi:hypothetical protein